MNEKDDGYEHVLEYIPIGTPTAETISKLSEITAGDDHGDRELVILQLIYPFSQT